MKRLALNKLVVIQTNSNYMLSRGIFFHTLLVMHLILKVSKNDFSQCGVNQPFTEEIEQARFMYMHSHLLLFA